VIGAIGRCEIDVMDETLLQPDRPAIGRYQVIRQLGQGAFGLVYLARDDALDRDVAIKVPNPERLAGPQNLDAYLAEARALAKLDHPNIVPVYDAERTEDGLGYYVVSKFIAGTNLAERIKQGRPGYSQAAELAATVALALHSAHTHGLVHRDIKPANILIDGKGEPRLVRLVRRSGSGEGEAGAVQGWS
jgi:serine/threonine protein kinase